MSLTVPPVSKESQVNQQIASVILTWNLANWITRTLTTSISSIVDPESSNKDEADNKDDPKTAAALCLKTKGNVCASQGINVAMRYICDIDDNIIDGHRASAIHSKACEIWNELQQRDLVPAVWGDLTTSAKSYFLHHMYQSFPEVSFCEGHWKALWIATNNYSQWRSEALKKQKATSSLGQDHSAHGHLDHCHHSLKKVPRKTIGKHVVSPTDHEEGALEPASKRIQTVSSTHHDDDFPELDGFEDYYGSQGALSSRYQHRKVRREPSAPLSNPGTIQQPLAEPLVCPHGPINDNFKPDVMNKDTNNTTSDLNNYHLEGLELPNSSVIEKDSIDLNTASTLGYSGLTDSASMDSFHQNSSTVLSLQPEQGSRAQTVLATHEANLDMVSLKMKLHINPLYHHLNSESRHPEPSREQQEISNGTPAEPIANHGAEVLDPQTTRKKKPDGPTACALCKEDWMKRNPTGNWKTEFQPYWKSLTILQSAEYKKWVDASVAVKAAKEQACVSL
ncbi:uncharacterized protein ARMOST_03431 [Armillaria ostoyae]|uniref:Uncharacterized protein n=1 Tax=Armillaria ostoyae TaxID=47428 RepID=A0A284QUJ6_ARMOS|nr:uncharacterized protein ARMOST_03431 [Armillaria ostoyae]